MKQRPIRAKPFKELQDEWYAKLKSAGFQDIEDVSKSDRPLKEWHSRKFSTERSRIRQADREKYNQQIADFINHHKIDEICILIAKHGNRPVRPKTVKKILELHHNGLTERKIAARIRRSKTCIHQILEKGREWMRVA